MLVLMTVNRVVASRTVIVTSAVLIGTELVATTKHVTTDVVLASMLIGNGAQQLGDAA